MARSLACPVCGQAALAADAARVARCGGCGHRFPADADGGEPTRRPKDGSPPARLPQCPACDRQVSWGDTHCPYCGQEFEDEAERGDRWAGPTRRSSRRRRDAQPHRGRFLAHLGNLTLTLGWLGCCTFGTTAVVVLPLALTTIGLCGIDLRRMGRGEVDSGGRAQVETARGTAAAGLLVAVLFGGLYLAALWLR